MDEIQNVKVFEDFVQNPVQVITLDQLAMTHKENYPDGTPVGGIYHYQLIQLLLEGLERRGIAYEMKDVFVAQNRFKRSPGISVLPEVAAREGDGSCASHIVRRVFANITLSSMKFNDEVGYNMALSYTQSGILLGFGPHVFACKNQTICRAESMVSNYTVRGYKRLTTEARNIHYFLKCVDEKLDAIHSSADEDFAMYNKLKSSTVTPEELTEIIGLLEIDHARATTSNPMYFENHIAPLNSAMISNFVMKALHEGAFEKENTAWDVVNIANRGMKPDMIPFENIVPQSLALTNLVYNYKLNPTVLYGRLGK